MLEPLRAEEALDDADWVMAKKSSTTSLGMKSGP
jgi:hypothetical protein